MSNNEDDFLLDDFAEGQDAGFSQPGPAAIRGTVRVGKVEYAVDLQWETPQEPGKADKEARAYAAGQTDRPDFYCVRKGVKTQFALGYASQGHKTNLPSLAAHICQSKGPSFAALYAVDGGYYLIAVRDDTILSDAERFIEDAGEARQELERLVSLYDFPEIIAPASMEIEDTREQAITAALSGRCSVRLKDIKRSSAFVKWAFAGTVAAAVLFGAKYWIDNNKVEELETDWKTAFEDAQTKVGLKEAKVEIPKMPWDGKQMGVRALEACVAEIGKYPLDIPGWTTGDMTCAPSGGNVDVAAFIERDRDLGRGGMPVTTAEQMVRFNGIDPQLDSGKNGDSSGPFAFKWAAPGGPRLPADIQTAKLGEIKTAVLKLMELRRTPVEFSPADSNDFWTGVNIEFETSLSPLGFADILGAIPGFLLEGVEYRIKENTYTIKGKAYEQLPLPENAVRR